MITNVNDIKSGVHLIDPIGRKHLVNDVFVPKNTTDKQKLIPSSYRQWGRKVIVFKSGSVIALSEAKQRYSLLKAPVMEKTVSNAKSSQLKLAYV